MTADTITTEDRELELFHLKSDYKLLQSHCREQAREIHEWKMQLSKVKLAAAEMECAITNALEYMKSTTFPEKSEKGLTHYRVMNALKSVVRGKNNKLQKTGT